MAILTAHAAFNTSSIPGVDGFDAETATHTSTTWSITDGPVTHTFTGTGFTYFEEDGYIELEDGVITGWTVSQGGSAVVTVTGGAFHLSGPLSPDAIVGHDIWDYGYLGDDGYPVYEEEADLAWFLRSDDTVNGSAFGDNLAGYEGNDHIYGNAGNDFLSGWHGNDTLDGGAGLDVAHYLNFRSESFVTKTQAGHSISSIVGIEGTDSLTGIERIVFHNREGVALDLDGNAGMVAKIIGAVFGAAAVNNPAFVGIGLHLADGGMGYEALASLAMQARATYTHADVVQVLWDNVIGVPLDAATKAVFVGRLDGGMTVGQLSMLAAETGENAANIGLTGLASTGLDYDVQGNLPF